MQRFVSLIISRFQNINPKEGKTVNKPTNVKSEIRMMTVDDEYFAVWKEIIERHHWGELINLDIGDMFKDNGSVTIESPMPHTILYFIILGTSTLSSN